MPPRDWRLRVRDILQAVERIRSFTQGLTVETFAADERTIAAVSYELLIIGEAARRVPEETRVLAPDVPWQDMADMRNLVAHEYFGIDIAIVWQTATEDVPKLGPPLRALLSE